MTKFFLHPLIYTFFVVTQCRCQEKKTAYNTKSIELNNIAVQFMGAQKFDSALLYLDKAIEIDANYYVAYGNKSSIYCSLKDLKNALIETQKEIKVKPDLAEAWTFAGMLSDRLGDTLTSMTYYKRSVALFDERIINPSKQEFLEANKRNRAISLILMGQEEEGRNELKKLKEAHPDDKFLDDLMNLSKQDYLNQIFDDQ